MASPSDIDLLWMHRALELAGRGRGSVEPNPMVGAVVLDATDEFAGEGWHERYGGPHAEVHALNAAGDQARGGTLYVTLEPCCHHGKTPPCTEAILRSGIRRAVVSLGDPFPAVSGGGISQLQQAGLQVELGLADSEAKPLYGPYFKLLSTGKPWVIAKWAMSLDGKIATRTGDSQWISSEESRRVVHELRGRVDAVLVGRGTVLADDPMLTARPPGPRIAARVVVAGSGELPEACKLRSTIDEAPVLVFAKPEHLGKLEGWKADGAEVLPMETIEDVLVELGRRRFTNVLVEGGAGLLGSLFGADAIDVANAFIAPIMIGGSQAPSPVGGRGAEFLHRAMAFDSVCVERHGRDTLIRASRTRTTE